MVGAGGSRFPREAEGLAGGGGTDEGVAKVEVDFLDALLGPGVGDDVGGGADGEDAFGSGGGDGDGLELFLLFLFFDEGFFGFVGEGDEADDDVLEHGDDLFVVGLVFSFDGTGEQDFVIGGGDLDVADGLEVFFEFAGEGFDEFWGGSDDAPAGAFDGAVGVFDEHFGEAGGGTGGDDRFRLGHEEGDDAAVGEADAAGRAFEGQGFFFADVQGEDGFVSGNSGGGGG